MTRLDALGAIYDRLQDAAVVTIMGAVAAELQSLGHRQNFFYLQHAMGLASSVGLGIALARPTVPVVVLDGDGSLLMNLGGLSTMARYRPPNLIHIVFDNESLLSVGGFPTATGSGTDLAAVAQAAGVPRTAMIRTTDDVRRAFDAARASSVLTTIVAKVEAVGPSAYVTDLPARESLSVPAIPAHAAVRRGKASSLESDDHAVRRVPIRFRRRCDSPGRPGPAR